MAGLFDADVAGYVERDVSQIQATATRVFGPTLGANGLVFLTEVALMQVHDMPDKSMEPLESPAGGVLEAGTRRRRHVVGISSRGAPRLQQRRRPDQPVPLFPVSARRERQQPLAQRSVRGGPDCGHAGVRADYLSRWQADLGYTRYAGDGNELSDRDFVSASVKYSF